MGLTIGVVAKSVDPVVLALKLRVGNLGATKSDQNGVLRFEIVRWVFICHASVNP